MHHYYDHILWSNYHPDWPACPGCGQPALDCHRTCGQAQCREHEHAAGTPPVTDADIDATLRWLDRREKGE